MLKPAHRHSLVLNECIGVFAQSRTNPDETESMESCTQNPVRDLSILDWRKHLILSA